MLVGFFVRLVPRVINLVRGALNPGTFFILCDLHYKILIQIVKRVTGHVELWKSLILKDASMLNRVDFLALEVVDVGQLLYCVKE